MPLLRVLLIEDNPVDALLVQSALEEMVVFEPVMAHVDRVSRAEALLATEKFDVVLLDLKLPDGDGLPNFTRLNEATPQTPFIVLTGLADEKMALQAIQLGAEDYLFKGAVDPALLERSIRYAIERKRHENSRIELARARIARAEAEAANRTKDEFLATLSHELRTPLNAILGWASLMRTGQLNEVEKTQALETIERNARVQAQLIEDLLDVSRIVTGNLRLQWLRLKAGEVMVAAVDATRPMAGARQIELHVELEDVPEILADPTRLQQVLMNLLANAIKFTPMGGNVWARVARGPEIGGQGTVQLSVRDDGAGIAPEFLPEVFERFRQGDGSSTRRHGGLGLGLSIVRHLVAMHGGLVKGHSDGLGQGACFEILLPVAGDGREVRPLAE